MTKRYAMLQKKLQELESQLSYVFSLPTETTPCHQLVSENIKNRFLFLKNLLSTEIASSHPSKPPQHLHHIANRLTELETAFRDWDKFRISNFDNNNLETDSICSCTESCVNDDEDGDTTRKTDTGDTFWHSHGQATEYFPGSGFMVYDVPECFRQAMEYDDEKAHDETVEKVEINGDHDHVKRDENKVAVLGKYIGAMASGAMLGAIMMGAAMATFYDCSQIIVCGGHLIPT